MKTFPFGGIHPDANKLTADMPLKRLEPSATLAILLSQNIGAPSRPVVKAGDVVGRYQLLAEAGGFVGAPLHSPVHATVKKIEKVRDHRGFWRDAIILETRAEAPEGWRQPEPRTPEAVAALSGAEIVSIVRDAGIVGLGGASFPTAVKLTPPEGKHPEFVIINGAECEPWLTRDDRLMREYPHEICHGARLLARAVGVSRIIFGIEENKPEAIRAIREAAGSDIEVVVLKKKYPQGGEKQLIAACMGRQVPDGALPVDVGAIVDNVATAYAVWNAVYNCLPLTECMLTVTGKEVSARGNFIVPVGMSIDDVLDRAGGIPADTGKIVAGGPMMGQAVSHTEAPLVKSSGGILCLPQKDSERTPMDVCIRCGRCVDVCPMGLEPYLLMTLSEMREWDDIRHHHVMSCIECGSCSYICPASRPLLDFIKLAKTELRKNK